VDDAAVAGIKAKLARAHKYLDALDDEIAAFAEKKPYGVRGEVDPKRRQWVAYFVLKEPLPIELSVTVGDIAHNLRSALDHIAYALVPKRARDRRTAFPIVDHPEDFFCSVKHAAKRGRGPLKGLDPDGPAFAFFEWAQPYNRRNAPDEHPLRILSALNNEDKHRAIVARNTMMPLEPAPEAAVVALKDIEVADEYTVEVHRPLEDDTEIMCTDVTITGDDPQVHMYYEFHFEIAFGKHPVTPADLRFLRDAVGKVVQSAAEVPA
jgi:hypothetical protein